jgi:nitrogen fixation protein NifB
MRMTAMSEERKRLQGKHPCFSLLESDHRLSARLHLPVSPGCNIQCGFCHRDNSNRSDQRPGVARRLLTPDQAVEVVNKALVLCPSLKVVGIAGPGDPLYTDHAVRTFAKIHAIYPDLIKCVSTNGLKLPDRIGELEAAGVQTLTVTVNAVDPEIERQITSFAVLDGQRYEGLEAAQLLIARQLEGIRKAAERRIVVKINAVLIPGLNEHHIGQIAHQTAAAGASLINIIPLIPQYRFSSTPAPTEEQIQQARQQAAEYLEIFGHCKRCRADAFGIPGLTDLSKQLYEDNEQLEATFSHG